METKKLTKDWIGNKKSTFVTLGASSHSESDREDNDYYATDPRCAVDLIDANIGIKNIWECACGEGHLAQVFDDYGLLSKATDLIDRGYGIADTDFLIFNDIKHDGWIVTNPPYKFAVEFCEKALSITPNVAMFLKLTFLEGQKRLPFFKENPPIFVYVYSSRRKCAINGDFDAIGSSATAYAWFVWKDNFKGEPVIRWIQ